MAPRAWTLLVGVACAVPACRLGESLDEFYGGSPPGADAGGGPSGGAGGADASAGAGAGGAPDAGGDSTADVGCGPGRKLCPAGCASESDPAVGCAAEGCSPCSLPKAVAGCDQGACSVESCETGWGDCDGNPENGCERDVSSDTANCGGCDRQCGSGESCLGGLCCATGLESCDGACVDTDTDVSHCGDCGNVCTAAPSGGSPACEGGVCTFVCTAPLAKCGAICTDTDTDVAHCGACDVACPVPPGSAATCSGGTCGFECLAGFETCGTDCADLATDPEHCGSCGRSCFGGACLGGGACGPSVVSAGNNGPTEIVADGAAVYWTNQGGEVKKRDLAAASDDVVATNQDNPTAVAVDATHVYWARPVQGRVNRALLTGGAPSVFMSSIPGVISVALGAQDVYIGYGGTPGFVWSRPKSGATGALVTANAEQPLGLTIVGQTLYWANRNANEVVRYPLPSGPIDAMAPAASPADVAVHLGTLYYTNAGDGTVRSTTGGGAWVEIASGQQGPLGIDVDATGVYWADTTAGTVMRAPLGGGTAEVLASSQSSPWDVALDVTSVYWTNSGSGQVMRLAK